MVVQEVFKVLRVKHFHFPKIKKPLLVGTAFALMIVEVIYGELLIRTPGVQLRQDSVFLNHGKKYNLPEYSNFSRF